VAEQATSASGELAGFTLTSRGSMCETDEELGALQELLDV
jgi:hypothetical protein